MTNGSVPRQRFGPPPLPHDEERLVIGLGSGSSLDGVDAALVAIRGSCETASLELRHFLCVDYDDDTRERLLDLFNYENATVDKLCVMHAILGELFAEAALLVAEQHGTPMAEVECIGIWGHMMYHLPAKTAPFEWRGRKLGSSLQIGDLSRVALRTGVTTIGDIAAGDIAAGGNGSPFTALLNYALYHDPSRNRVVQNVGGIANCDILPAAGDVSSVIGFDTGPGVMVIDGLVRHYTEGDEQFDREGQRAARGTVDDELLEELMKDPYIQMPPPKAAGRENYGTHFVRRIIDLAEQRGLSPDDVVATGTALTAESIALNYDRYLRPACTPPTGTIDEVIVSGGGALNKTLLKMLGDRVRCQISTCDDYGLPSFGLEAVRQTFHAHETYIGHTNHAPSAFGASRDAFLGVIAPGYGRPPLMLQEGWRAARDEHPA